MTSMTKPRLGDLLRGTPRTFSYLDGTHDVCRVFFSRFLFFGLDHNIPQNPWVHIGGLKNRFFEVSPVELEPRKKVPAIFPKGPHPRPDFPRTSSKITAVLKEKLLFFCFFQKMLAPSYESLISRFWVGDAPAGRNTSSIVKPRLGIVLRGIPQRFSYSEPTGKVLESRNSPKTVFFGIFAFRRVVQAKLFPT